MHGWNGSGSDPDELTLYQMASMGFFVASVGLRGRDGADGARDASGREIYDIYDVLLYIRSHYAQYVSQDLAVIVGYSGGGGNALAAACKFPDTFSCVVDFYGMSDYAAWYGQGTWEFYQESIGIAIGGAPNAAPNNYYSRDATAAITNYTGGKIVIFHDIDDGIVPVTHSQEIVTVLDAAGMTNYETHYSQSGDTPRWTHGSGEDFDSIGIAAKDIWVPTAKAQAAWTIPASGTITVIGYIKTKRFTIWLNTGLDAAATVVYDTATGTYTITPLTSNAVVAVTITQGALTASGNTNGATLFTVA
jgi:pimeloyl-ACP methyl ester carboxylesterase